MLSEEVREHLCRRLIPFWAKLRDRQYGGYYGWMDSRLKVEREAVKGCILNSRILWFFSNAWMCLGAEETADGSGSGMGQCGAEPGLSKDGLADVLQECADWAYRFLRDKCVDADKGGVYWSLDYKGQPEDTTKHTYNQAFAVYALSSYYRAFRDREALALAESLIEVIETECFDEHGYKEALDREFHPIANDKLSENGVMADRTMNTLLHVMEAYTEYLLACRETEQGGNEQLAQASEAGTGNGADGQDWKGDIQEQTHPRTGDAREQAHPWTGSAQTASAWEQVVAGKLEWILDLIADRVYNPALHRQEVFFNLDMESLIDLHSYGHDIEAAWLIDRCLETLGEERLTEKLTPVIRSLEREVYEKAYTKHSLANECECGVVDAKRVWWVQAEGVVGFFNAYQKTGQLRYLAAAEDIWQFIRTYLVDERPEGEWFWYTDENGAPALEKPIVEPWKCPYHNGRMCMEIMNRTKRA